MKSVFYTSKSNNPLRYQIEIPKKRAANANDIHYRFAPLGLRRRVAIRFDLGRGAVVAFAEYLNRMSHIGKAVFCRDLVGPGLDGQSSHLDDPATFAAHEVMMMLAAAQPVQNLSRGRVQNIYLAQVGQRPQDPIDGGQGYPLAAGQQSSMYFLSGAEIRLLAQYRPDRGALLRVAANGGAGALPIRSLA